MQIQITLLACLPPLLSLSPCLPFCHAPLLLSMHSPGLLLCCQLKNDSKSITAGQGGQGKQARPQSDRWSWSWSCRRGGGGWVSGSWRSINNSCGMFYGRSSKPFHTHTRTPRWVCKRDFQMLTACQRSWAFIGMSMLMSDHTWHPPPPRSSSSPAHSTRSCTVHGQGYRAPNWWAVINFTCCLATRHHHCQSPVPPVIPSCFCAGAGARAPFVNDLPPQRMRWVRRCVHSIKQLPPFDLVGAWGGTGYWLLVLGLWCGYWAWEHVWQVRRVWHLSHACTALATGTGSEGLQ